MRINLFLFLSAIIYAGARLWAAELGDKAADLDIKEWVKGSPVKLTEKADYVSVVEFWATWCPPCRESIPHLTEMQKKFKTNQVVFIGVTDEESKVVRDFVKKTGDKMDYVVAIDGGGTSKGYMEAYGVRGIPHAFVVNKEKKVIWQGHPMDRLEEVLREIIAGKYDLAKEKKRTRMDNLLGELNEAAGKDPRSNETAKLEKELSELLAEFPGAVPKGFDLANFKKMARARRLVATIRQQLSQGKETEAATAFRELDAFAPGDYDLEQLKAQVELNKLVGIWRREATAGNKASAGAARKIMANKAVHAMVLNEMAWDMMTDDEIKAKDSALALEIAKMACEKSEWNDAAILDTYALALFENGKKKEAIEYQKKAISLAEDEESKKSLQAALERYESAK